MLHSIYSSYPTLTVLWVVIGILTGLWTFLDFYTNGFHKEHYSAWDWVFLTLMGVFFFVLDVFIWPIYIVEKLLEAMWNFRQRR